MPRRRLLLSLLPSLAFGFSPAALSPPASVSSRSCYRWSTHAFATSSSGSYLRCAAGATLDRSRSSMARDGRLGVSMMASPIAEESVTAEEANELINKAKTIVEADMGVKAADMLSPEFRFLWQFNGDLTLDEYLTKGQGPYATLRTALPDLFWNAYDFRVDKYQNNRVWATTRLTGTHNGPLVFDGKEYPASGTRVEAAPECVSMVFDKTSGLCTKITGGFCLDRGAGNTGPAGGIWGVLQAIGEPVSAWKYFPPAKVLVDVVGPTFRQKKSAGMAKPPFREAIAVALAKQVLTAGRTDPESLAELLADDLQVYGPVLGPLKKREFLKSSVVDLKDFFSGLEYDSNFYDGRVDPLEPSRVWLTTRLFGKVVGPIEGFGLKFDPKRSSYQAGPETYSITFDESGLVSKITLACPMDTEVGETNGLGNFLGILEGLGIPFPEFFSRPAPESFRRFLDSVIPVGMKKKPGPKAKRSAPALTLPTMGLPAASTAAKISPAPPAGKAKATAKPKAAAVAASKVTASAPSSKKPAAGVAKKLAPAMKKPVATAPKAAAKPIPAVKKPVVAASKATPKPAGVLKKSIAAAAPDGALKSASKKPAPKPVSKKPAPKPATEKPAPKPVMASSSSKATRREAAPAAGGNSGAPSSSLFGGMFSFGGGGGSKSTPKAKEGGAAENVVASTKQAPAPKKTSPTPAPVKKASPVPPPPAPVAPKGQGVTFSPALAQKLEPFVGSGAGLSQLAMRTDLYARGGISVMDYWGTLKKELGPNGVQNLVPDIIGSLPAGNQKSALFKIYSTQ